jgi:hypothetical protein
MCIGVFTTQGLFLVYCEFKCVLVYLLRRGSLKPRVRPSASASEHFISQSLCLFVFHERWERERIS